jgi:hypothetical protein
MICYMLLEWHSFFSQWYQLSTRKILLYTIRKFPIKCNIIRNLQIYDWIHDSFLDVITTCDLLRCLVTLDKLHKIIVEKTIHGIELQRYSHKDAIYTNFSSIQTNLCGIVILWLILWLKNVLSLFIFVWISII